MTDSDLAERIRRQFSYRGDRADIWRGFDAFLDTDAFLNLGYSPQYGSHLLGSPQRRLADRVGRELDRHVDGGRRLLDVGCGRGGPAIRLATAFGFDVVGVDFVPYNVERARENALAVVDDAPVGTNNAPSRPSFLLADGRNLPVASNSISACTAVDSIVYVPDPGGLFAELERVLEPGGVGVVTDLLVDDATNDADDADVAPEAIDRFADAWDMPPLSPVSEYLETIDDAGLEVIRATDMSAHSVGRFRKWTRLYLATAKSPLRPVLDRLLGWYGLDPDVVESQVRAAHDALPALRHVLVRFRT